MLHSVLIEWCGVLQVPAVSHGAALASCWLLGALAGRAYENGAYGAEGGAEVTRRILKSGAFAVGILLVATQARLTLTLGGFPFLTSVASEPSELSAIDVEIIRTISELSVDIGLEAVTMIAWRRYRYELYKEFND